MIWSVSAAQYFTPDGGHRHLIDGSQLYTCQSALCDHDPGIYPWQRLGWQRMAKYPKCRRCRALLARKGE